MKRFTALWTVLMLALAGCNLSDLIKTVPVAPPKPQIFSFTASPASIQALESSTLSWSVSGATSLSISEGVGDVTGEESVSVTPEATTTYTLTATNSRGSSSAEATVTVENAAESGFELHVGPFNAGATEPWTYFLIYDDIPEADFPAEGENAEVTITGPEGWGGGFLSISKSRASFERGWSALFSQKSAVAGEYRIEATLNGTLYQGTATLSDLSLLPEPQNVSVSAFSSSEVTASWDAVPGAQSYYVGLVTPDRSLFVETDNIDATTMTFGGLTLEPGSYMVEVVAFTFDTTAAMPPRPSSVQASYGKSSPFTLPLLESTFYPVDSVGAYLPRDPEDPANPATALQLSVLGVTPGECLGMVGSGDYSPRIVDNRPDASTSMIGVFGGSGGFVAPGPQGTYEPIVTPSTSDGMATDIPEDFNLRGLMVIAEVPVGAVELLISPNDTFHSDNGDPDGDYGVYIAKVACA